MSEGLFKLFGLLILTAMLILLLRRLGGEGAAMLKVLGGVAAAGACLAMISPLIDYAESLCDGMPLPGMGEKLGILLQVLLVAILTHICATVCRDCGESTLASYAELGGKLEILLLCLPLMKDILEMAASMPGLN